MLCVCLSDVVTVFKRTLNSKGVSAYHVDGRRVEFGRYKEQLEDIGIWIEAKNFLVFQVRTTQEIDCMLFALPLMASEAPCTPADCACFFCLSFLVLAC
jgi:hypothetical protein